MRIHPWMKVHLWMGSAYSSVDESSSVDGECVFIRGFIPIRGLDDLTHPWMISHPWIGSPHSSVDVQHPWMLTGFIHSWSGIVYCWPRLQADTDPMSVKCWASVAGAGQYPLSPSQYFMLPVPTCWQYGHDASNQS